MATNGFIPSSVAQRIFRCSSLEAVPCEVLIQQARLATHARSTENPGLPTEARGGDCGAQGACVELVPTRDHLLLVAMAA